MKLAPSDVRDIAAVLAAWSHRDDWNVVTVNTSTAVDLIRDLAAGDDPVTLIRIAHMTGRPYLLPSVAERIPHYTARAERSGL